MQIVIDGTEELYNRIKNYVNPKDNPYQRVMRNIGLMLDREISISIRMNIDQINHVSFEAVAKDLINRYPGNRLLSMYAYPIIGDYSTDDEDTAHADERWIAQKVIELNDLAQDYKIGWGLGELPHLEYLGCMADNERCIVISASGLLGKCCERFRDSDRVGTLSNGITEVEVVKSWHQVQNYEHCFNCAFAPTCVQLKKCDSSEHCYKHAINHRYICGIKQKISIHNHEGGDNHEF
ncbi:MAG: hypothetical protein Q4B18_07770, partial [Bacillota bacterium]|nr:hypothetical protein [Bacillota bacterium]